MKNFVTFFLGDFTIFESDFLELRRTDLDLEADPEELGDLFNFDLEDLELAPFDGSAACDLDSVSDLKISAASSIPFFFSVPEVVRFALGLLNCFCLLSDNDLDVSFVGCFISFLSPWDIGLKPVLQERCSCGSWTSEAAANIADNYGTFEAAANIAKLLLTGDVDTLFGSKPRSWNAGDFANIADTFDLGDSCLDLGEFNVKGYQMSVSGSDEGLDLDSPDANVNGCQGPVFGFDGDLYLDRMDALWWAKLTSGSHESVLGTDGRQRRSMSNGSCFGTEKSIKSKTSDDRLPRRAKLSASLLTTPYVSLKWISNSWNLLQFLCIGSVDVYPHGDWHTSPRYVKTLVKNEECWFYSNFWDWTGVMRTNYLCVNMTKILHVCLQLHKLKFPVKLISICMKQKL